MNNPNDYLPSTTDIVNHVGQSLTTADVKKNATRFKHSIDYLMHPDQMGFMAGKRTSINIRQAFENMYMPSPNSEHHDFGFPRCPKGP